MTDWQDIIRRLGQPLSPRPTGQEPRLAVLPGIAAVMFDVYGTLLISASGEVGTAVDVELQSQFVTALRAHQVDVHRLPQSIGNPLLETIRARHAAAHQQGNPFPEVDIRDVWRATLQQLVDQGHLGTCPTDVEKLALEYEMRANPVWPMPGMNQCLTALRESGLTLGIISNAQFFTPPLIAALGNASLDELGFDPRLLFYSFEHEVAKPGQAMYASAAAALAELGIQPESTLYVGNDMRNDIWPAHELGFRTALFAADARSLRLRRDDARVAAVRPDLIITSLDQIPRCLAMSS